MKFIKFTNPALLLTVALCLAPITVTGQTIGNCAAPDPADFSKTTLVPNTPELLQMKVAPDNRIFYVTKIGGVYVYDPGSGESSELAMLDVSSPGYMGLLSIELDPGFPDNPWVYLTYNPGGDDYSNFRVSRFTFTGSQLDLASEIMMLELPNEDVQQSPNGTHTGGKLRFGKGRELYITGGDNRKHSEWGQLDDREAIATSLSTSGNTNHLQGKILRIIINEDASYSIPEGNLYPEGTENTRPEIHSMGVRNGYSLHYDDITGWLFLGDVGPQGNVSERGPAGGDEWHLIKEPSNLGWPMFYGPNWQFARWDYATSTLGELYDPENPINDSKWNTGLEELPLPSPSLFTFQKFQPEPDVIGLQGSGSIAVSGPFYRYDPAGSESARLPIQLHKKWIMGDNSQSKMGYLEPTEDGEELLDAGPLFRNLALGGLMDLQLGPDGVFYVLQYQQTISRIDYTGTHSTPAECGLVLGCMDPGYAEYNSLADFDDGSCVTVSNGTHPGSTFHSQLSGSRLIVNAPGPHKFILQDVKGRILHTARGQGPESHDLTGGSRQGLTIITVETSEGKQTFKIFKP